MKIPQANPGAFVRANRPQLDAAIARVLDSGRYIDGPEVAAFEREFAALLGGGHVIAVASGTEALWLALKAIGLQHGDEVITVSLTAGATVAAIVEAGGQPVFVDVDPDDLTLDPVGLASAITRRTAAVVPVHLYGQPAQLPAICACAQRAGLAVIEDCAHAPGAQYAGRPVGTWGQLGAFSFYPTKNLGALGDGGAIVTADASLADKLRGLREYGWRERLVSSFHGWNSRLDELQAAILRIRLPDLLVNNARRRAIAAAYTQAWADTGLTLPPSSADHPSVYHQYVARYARRDHLRAGLLQRGVETGIHYPVPIHLQAAYRRYGHGPGSLPVTERAANEVLSLPVHPELTEDQVATVIQSLRSVCEIDSITARSHRPRSTAAAHRVRT